MITIQNALVRGFGTTPNGMPSGQDFYITESGGGGGSNTSAVRVIPTGTTDTSLTTDGLIQWKSSTLGPKTETIIQGITNGQELQINDGAGNAALYPITLVGIDGSTTIGGNTSLVLSDNFFNITLVWDNFSNWIIASYYNGSKSVVGPAFLLVDQNTILSIDGSGDILL